MRFTKVLPLIVLLLSLDSFALKLNLVTEEYPPFNFFDKKKKQMVGISTEIITTMLGQANIDYSITPYPWARALAIAESEPNTCIFSAIRSADRESKFKWIGPIITGHLAFFALAEKNIQLKNFTEANKYIIGTYHGSIANEYLTTHGLKYDSAPEDILNLKKLELGRIDLWVASVRTGPYMAKHYAKKPIVKMLSLENVEESKMYLACTRKLDDQIVDRLNLIVKKMITDQVIDQIILKYN